MNQFTFSGRQKTFCLALMGIGVLSMAITYLTDDPYHTRFWSNILVNSVFFTGIAFIALFFYAAQIISYAGWQVVFKRIYEAIFPFLGIGLILMFIIGLGTYFGYHHLYHWADVESVATDDILAGKSAFLNPTWYIGATVVFGGIYYFIGHRLRRLSILEGIKGTMEFKEHKRMRVYAAIFLPLAGFTSAALIWLWVMSVDAHWYSTLFAWYNGASWLVAMLCITVLLMIYLKNQGYYEDLTRDHIHDVGKYIFAFSIFWTYLWFSQYMLIWYGNIGEETVYFNRQIDQYPILFYTNLIINFALPFLILMPNTTKRTYGTMTFVAAVVLMGHWLDYFLMIKPGTLHTAHELMSHGHEAAGHGGGHFGLGFNIPGFLDIGTLLGFAGLFLWVVFDQLSKAPLVAEKDPYIQESLHHHVQ